MLKNGSSRTSTPTARYISLFRRWTNVQFVTVTTSDDHMASPQVFFENIVVAPTFNNNVRRQPMLREEQAPPLPRLLCLEMWLHSGDYLA